MVNLGTPFSVKNRLSIFDMSPHLRGLLSRSQVVLDQVYSAACNMRMRHVTIKQFLKAKGPCFQQANAFYNIEFYVNLSELAFINHFYSRMTSLVWLLSLAND